MSVEEMIDKFTILYDGGDTIAVHGNVTDQQIDEIKAAKPQLLEYFRGQRKEETERIKKAHDTVNAIPGVALARKYYADAAMAMRIDIMAHSEKTLFFEEFAAQYPDIDFDTANTVLQIEQDRFSRLESLAKMAQTAYDHLAAGENPKTVAYCYELEKDKLYKDIIWN